MNAHHPAPDPVVPPTTEPLRDPGLESCRQRIEEATARATALFHSHAADELLRKPSPTRWSATECLEHLIVTANAYRPHLGSAIQRARRADRLASAPYRRGSWVGRFILKAVTDPAKPVPAPKSFQPSSSDLDPADVLRRFEVTQAWLLEMAGSADGIDLGLRLATPVSRWLKISLEQAFEIHGHHVLRHVRQAELAAVGE